MRQSRLPLSVAEHGGGSGFYASLFAGVREAEQAASTPEHHTPSQPDAPPSAARLPTRHDDAPPPLALPWRNCTACTSWRKTPTAWWWVDARRPRAHCLRAPETQFDAQAIVQQPLLLPVAFAADRLETVAAHDHAEALAAWLELAVLGPGQLAVRAAPALLKDADPVPLARHAARATRTRRQPGAD